MEALGESADRTMTWSFGDLIGFGYQLPPLVVITTEGSVTVPASETGPTTRTDQATETDGEETVVSHDCCTGRLVGISRCLV